MFEIWNALLNILSQLVIPDWGALVALLPIAIIALAVLTFALQFRKLAKAPPARRGFRPIEPATPAGHPHAGSVVRADLRGARCLPAVPGPGLRWPHPVPGRDRASH